MATEAGSFTKKTDGTGTQTVPHGLGEVPVGIIFLGTAKTSTGFTVHYLGAFGFSDGVDDGCIAWASQDAVNPSNAARLLTDTKAISFVDYDQNIIAEAHIDSWDSSNFILDWTTNDANAYNISYIIFTGSNAQANVITWDTPTSTGNKAVTGAGFQPTLVINLGTNVATLGVLLSANFSIGMVDSNGSQYVLSMLDIDAQAPTANYRSLYEKSHHTITTGGVTSEIANHVSLDPDGFTNNFTTVSGSARKVVSFCIKGIELKLGTFDKSINTSVPVDQAVTGLGFNPSVLLFMHSCQTVFNSIASNIKAGFGIASAAAEFAVHINSEHAQTPSDVDGLVKTDKCLVAAANHTQVIDAEADLKTLDTDGFTLTWTTNNAIAYKIAYLAFSDSDVVLISDTVTMVENLGFPAKDVWLTETITINDLLWQYHLTDTVSLIEALSFPVKSIWLTDTITVIDAQALLFSIKDQVIMNDTLNLAVLVQIAEQFNIQDSIALAIAIALTETVNIQDTIGRLLNMSDTVTLQELIGLILDRPLSGTINMSESISIIKSETVTFVEPDEVYNARARDRYLRVEKMKKLN
jgi:hypothetical protein